jgi:hypothetical protein
MTQTAENRSARSDGSSLPSSVIIDRDAGYYSNSVCVDADNKRSIVMSSRNYDSNKSNKNNNNSNNFSSSRTRRRSVVRFALQEETTVSEDIIITTPKTKTKMKMNEKGTNEKDEEKDEDNAEDDEEDDSPSPSVLWYTPHELKRIQQSFVVAVKKYEQVEVDNDIDLDLDNFDDYFNEDSNSLDRFSLRKRKRRRMVRNQMLDTCYAVKEFVKSIQTHHHCHNQEIMLSQLLQRYSNPMVIEAVHSASSLSSLSLSSLSSLPSSHQHQHQHSTNTA